MPLEIRELHIRVNVGGETPPPGGASAPGAAPGADDQDALLAACVDEVLRVLRERKER